MKTGASQVTSLGWLYFGVLVLSLAALVIPFMAHCRGGGADAGKLDRVLAELHDLRAALDHAAPAPSAEEWQEEDTQAPPPPPPPAAAAAAKKLRAPSLFGAKGSAPGAAAAPAAAAAAAAAPAPVPAPAPAVAPPPPARARKQSPPQPRAPAAAAAAAAGQDAPRFPAIVLNKEEAPWFDLSINNPGLASGDLPPGSAPLATLPYPPGLPSIAAYQYALASDTYAAMERFSAAFISVNAALVNEYQWHRDPLHAWSRKYEYVWHAEALRAALPPAHAQSLAATWPDLPAPPQAAPFHVLDAGSGFTFFDQYAASRLGVQLAALDQESSYIKFFGGLATALLPGEAPVPPIPYLLASIEVTGLPSASVDAITCVSVLEHVSGPNLQITVKEFKRILKPGGRLVMTFDSGQPPIAKNAAQSKELLEALRQHMVEDTSHAAPAALVAQDGGLATQLFSNRRATPPEFGETIFSISAHVFINAK
jgi:SAM-dependent methyltransferase